MNKVITASEMVSRLKDGMTLGIGGWGPRRKPMALIREILRSPVKDLTIVGYGGADFGMLCAAGKVKKAIYGFVSLDNVSAHEPHFRKAREKGQIEARELDEGLLYLGLRAAGMRVPFLPTRIGPGTAVMDFNPDFKTITSPYDDKETLLAMPAIKLDVAIVHCDRADRLGNTQTEGPDTYFDEFFVRAARQTYVSTEELHERLDLTASDTARANLFERFHVTGVIEAPLGAHPSSYPYRYGWDGDHFKTYLAAAAEEGGWDRYVAEFITPGEKEYLAKVGGAERVAKLPLPVF